MALIIANILAWYILDVSRGIPIKDLLEITTKSMAPAGTIILLTGAGGVFKQVLVRVLQGSATVAMITAAGLVAPLLVTINLSGIQLAAIVIAIASGASIFSHVNDSGFWLIKEYLSLIHI